MNLHRVEGKPEWAAVRPADMNVWQRVASRSGGILTIGNYFSLLGLLSVPLGLTLLLDGRYIAGIVVLLLGRFCDLLDGFLADRTGTKSPLGEKIDATFDKLSTGATVIALFLMAILPSWAVAAIVVPHVAIAVLALAAYFRGRGFHPSRVGKISMALIWVTLVAFIAVWAVPVNDPVWRALWAGAIYVAATVLAGVTGLLGLVALAGYIKEFLYPGNRSQRSKAVRTD